MFARLLLLIAIFTGLMAGPASSGGGCGGDAMVERCDCCLIPSEVTCCDAPAIPVQRTPASSENANQGQLKLAIQPMVALLPPRLCVRPPVVCVPARELGPRPISHLIDRICIRLI
jgi:hypothetical protein